MDIPKRYLSLFLLTMFITTNADAKHSVPVPNGPSTTGSVFHPFGKITVEIINDLGNTLALKYHCKSKEDDFGKRSLQPGQSWSFKFHRQFFGRTLFYCSFVLPNGKYSFNIYEDHRESAGDNWCQKCVWKIRLTGPCRLNDVTKQFAICYSWNKSLY